MSVNLLMEHHLDVLRLKGGYTDLSESTLVKMPHCRKSRHSSHANKCNVNWIKIGEECSKSN